MGHVATSLSLPYPVELVFRVATRVADLPRWMPEVVSAELLDPALAVGSRVRLGLSSAAAGAEVTAAVTELTPPTRLVMAGSGGPLGITVRVTLRETPAAATTASLELDLDTPPFLGFLAREAERRIEAGLPSALERLRALIEAEPA